MFDKNYIEIVPANKWGSIESELRKENERIIREVDAQMAREAVENDDN